MKFVYCMAIDEIVNRSRDEKNGLVSVAGQGFACGVYSLACSHPANGFQLRGVTNFLSIACGNLIFNTITS